MGREVNNHQVVFIRELESKIALMQRKQTKVDEKKNELYTQKKKALTENAKLKNDLKECQEKLAEVTKGVNKPDVTEVDQKCRQCKLTCKESKNMESHIASAHSLQPCHICSEVFTSKAAMRNHVKKHLNNELEYICGVCKEAFTSIEEAKDHGTKVCGSIYEKDADPSSKKPENPHECNACDESYYSNKALEKHIKEIHESYDCDKCKSQEDIYRHANRCGQVLGPYMCDNCNRELISKAGLTKHIEKCHGDKPSQSGSSYNDPCKIGPNCRFLKAQHLLYKHEQLQDEPWKTVQPRRQRR